MNTENSKTTNELHKFVLNFSQTLDVRSSNKHVALQNLSIYYTWKNTRQQYKGNKLEIIVLTWNDEFELPDRCHSVSNIHNYIEYIIKNHETLTSVLPIYVYINRINNVETTSVENERWV